MLLFDTITHITCLLCIVFIVNIYFAVYQKLLNIPNEIFLTKNNKKRIEENDYLFEEEDVETNLYNNNNIQNDIYKDENDGEVLDYFTKCNSNSSIIFKDENTKCLYINFPIFDKSSHTLLLSPKKNEQYLLPNSDAIPFHMKFGGIGYCGFGKLLFDKETMEWSCHCSANDYFGGEMCDEPQSKMIKQNKCVKVAHISDILNENISLFNPFIDGVCTQCVSPDTQVPIVNYIGGEKNGKGLWGPVCKEINSEEEEEEEKSFKMNNIDAFLERIKNPCKYDAINPHLFNSPNNFYDSKYGCVCDYHNGFVEAILLSSPMKNEQVSHACIKIGENKLESFHRTDVAYYTLRENMKPIQIHSYKNLVYPFNIIFPSNQELLVKQRILTQSDHFDWLNRVIKPNRNQMIRRTLYPNSKWPVVNKKGLVNYYSSRNETYPISAFRLATGRGFETKHWYETTSERYFANAVIGRPIIYTYHNDTPWTGRVTINPLGPHHHKYYGATLLTKPGEIVRLDPRGYEQENNHNLNPKVITIPPNYKSEMMDESTIQYIGWLFTSYTVKN